MTPNSYISIILYHCILLLLSNFVIAQNIHNKNPQYPYTVTKINENIIFDGIPDEPFWDTMDFFPLLCIFLF